jgi:hypothetical protein
MAAYIYVRTRERVNAKRDISFDVNEGELVCVVRMPPQPPLSERDKAWARARLAEYVASKKANKQGMEG